MENFTIDKNYEIDHFENECPQCHKGIHLGAENILGQNTLWEKSFEIFFKCPKCKKAFISSYYRSEKNRHYTFVESKPFIPDVIQLPDELVRLSDQFCEIYKQSFFAEKYGLLQIAGIGYRKALEFLIKDYLINCKGEDQAKIENEFLGKCIARIANDRIKAAATRAVWLGNDEAHYTRLFDDKNLADLKKLLKIAMDYITNEIMLDSYEKDMPE